MVAVIKHWKRTLFGSSRMCQIFDTKTAHVFCRLIKDCWAGDPKDRPNFSKVIERLEIIEQQFPPVDYTLADMRCRCNIL
jgi:hypothetical protein